MRITSNAKRQTPNVKRQTSLLFFSLLAFFLASLLPFFLPVSIHALPEFWTTETSLSLGPDRSNEPAICTRGPEVFVAWSDNRLGRWEIFFRHSPDGGVTWRPEERVTVTRTDSVQPAIACDRRGIHLVWQSLPRSIGDRSATQTQISYKFWDGIAWHPTQILSREGFSVRRPKIATTELFPGGLIYVVWEGQALAAQSNRPQIIAFITRSSDGGLTWLNPQPITSGNWNTSEPDVAGGVRAAYVAWRDGREATSQIFVKRWDEVTVSEDFRLGANGNCRRPSISALEPQVFVAWECSLNETAPVNIFASESKDRAETWESAQQISFNTAESNLPQIVVRRDDAWVFWQDGTSGNQQVHFAQHLQSGWTPAAQFTGNGGDSILPALTTSASTAIDAPIHLVWVELADAAQSTIFYTQRDTIPPERPAQPTHLDFDAPPGFDNDLQLTFSWETPTDRVEIGYHVFASIDGAGLTEIGSTNNTTFTFNSEDNKSYRVVIQAADSVDNRSDFSEPSAPVFVDGSLPTVQIHLPVPDTVITHPIPVIATCFDSNLVECRLQFGATASPSSWTLLGESIHIPFERERLIVWDTSNLDGIYTLALTAIDEAGNRETTQVPLVIDNTPPLPIVGEAGATLLTDENLEVSFRTPVWSSDGEKIAFSSNEGGAKDIWQLDLRSNIRNRLTPDAAIDLNPAWHPVSVPPDTDRLVFQSQRNGQWEIWTVRSDGSDHRPLIAVSNIGSQQSAIINFETPAWSPTGRQLAFAADLDGDSEIWIVRNADDVLLGTTPDLFQLTRNTAKDIYPTWAPDETQLAFQSDRTGNWEIWQINIDGSDEKRVYQDFANETFPRWSPDGKSLLFLSDRSGSIQSAFALNLRDGSLPTQISPIGIPIDSVDWSPDGREIVYQSGDRLYRQALEFPAPTIEALITRPYTGEQLRGKIDLFGLARGVLFQEYRLEYVPLSNLDDWHRIGGRSTVPVTREGFLGQWDAQRLRGEYVIRLVVVSGSGDEIEDRIRISIENERPRLEILHPPDDLLTPNAQVIVRGRTEKQAAITLKFDQISTPLPVDEAGNFVVQLFLRDGANRIEITATNAMELETHAHRTVFRDSQPPEIDLDSPLDFAVFNVPYVAVSGQVRDDADVQLSINGIDVPLKMDWRFERMLQLKEGTNVIRVEAVDRLDRTTEQQRRVIYEKKEGARRDLNPPAITDVLPPDGAILEQSDVRITALLIDDIEINPLTIRFSFDGEEFVFDGTENAVSFDSMTFDFRPETGQFIYTPPIELIDGSHRFELEIQDTAGNLAAPIDFTFVIDRQPFEALITAQRIEGEDNTLKITLVANKQLTTIPGVEVRPSGSTLGYTMNLDQFSEEQINIGAETDSRTITIYRYEGDFAISPSQSGFLLSTRVRSSNRGTLSVRGYFTDQDQFSDAPLVPFPQSIMGQVSLLTATYLFIDGGPSVMFLDGSPPLRATLRSQGGSDQSTILAQQQNAEDRGLTILQPVYVVESPAEVEEIAFRIALPLPPEQRKNGNGVALFQWDSQFQRWQSLDAIKNQLGMLEAIAEQFGGYALLVDRTPPSINAISPTDQEEIPLDRFLIVHEITDEGSGVDVIRLWVDDQPVQFLYEQETARLTYLPGDLDPGRHTLEISTTDRAGNEARGTMVFFTRDIFDFADEVVAYPNPASRQVTITFKLTKSADVELKIYDVAGQLLYTDELHNVIGQQSALRNEAFIWECKNQAGETIASGVYIYTLEAAREGRTVRRTGKVAVVR